MIALRDLDEVLGRTRLTSPDPELAELRARMREAVGWPRIGVGGLDLSAPLRGNGLGAPSFSGLARGVFRDVTFRSNVSPPVTWDPSAPSAPDAGPSLDIGAVGRFVQPTFDVRLQTGETFTIAPAGAATGDYRVIVGGVVVAVAGSLLAALWLGYMLGRRRSRRRA